MIERITARRRAAGEEGFTLIELLVVIIILGILAAVVVFAVGGVGDKGQSSACVIDTRTLQTALEAHFADQGNYGATPTQWDGTPPEGARTQIVEDDIVDEGFLSEESELHDVYVYDNNPNATDISPAIEVRRTDTRCGTDATSMVVGVGNNL